MKTINKKHKTPKEVKGEAIVKKLTTEANKIVSKAEAIRNMEAEMDLSLPFNGVNKVTANLMLDGIYPAMLINGSILLVEVLKGFFLDFEKFKTLEDKLPIEVYVRIERFYLMDWNEYNG